MGIIGAKLPPGAVTPLHRRCQPLSQPDLCPHCAGSSPSGHTLICLQAALDAGSSLLTQPWPTQSELASPYAWWQVDPRSSWVTSYLFTLSEASGLPFLPGQALCPPVHPPLPGPVFITPSAQATWSTTAPPPALMLVGNAPGDIPHPDTPWHLPPFISFPPHDHPWKAHHCTEEETGAHHLPGGLGLESVSTGLRSGGVTPESPGSPSQVVRSPGPRDLQRTRPTSSGFKWSQGPLGSGAQAHVLSTVVALATSLEGCSPSLGPWGGGWGLREHRPRSVLRPDQLREARSLAGPIAEQTSADWKVANICP